MTTTKKDLLLREQLEILQNPTCCLGSYESEWYAKIIILNSTALVSIAESLEKLANVCEGGKVGHE